MKIKKILKNPGLVFAFLGRRGWFHRMDDKKYLKIMYRVQMGKKLNLDSPTTFNEKLQWLKLYDRNPLYTKLVDKYEVKKYVADLIGEKYIIPTLGVWNSFEEINFDALPDRFVLKCTHDCGSIVIVKDKSKMDKKDARRKLEKSMKRNYYYGYREWPYKNVRPRIIAEKYMEDNSTHDLRDYKFFAFDGVVKALFIATDRAGAEETKFDFFDADFNHLDFTNGHPNADVYPQKPQRFDEMKALASRLSKNIAQVRVDFYEVNGEIYFGELTFSHWGGVVPFEPEEWDEVFGSWINLK